MGLASSTHGRPASPMRSKRVSIRPASRHPSAFHAGKGELARAVDLGICQVGGFDAHVGVWCPSGAFLTQSDAKSRKFVIFSLTWRRLRWAFVNVLVGANHPRVFAGPEYAHSDLPTREERLEEDVLIAV